MSLTVYSPSLGGSVPTQVASNPESTSIADSEGSNDNLLQSSPPAQVQPPVNDDPVQYAQIEHQDTLL